MTYPGSPACWWRSWNPDLQVPPISQERTAWVSIRVKGEDAGSGHQGRGGRTAPSFLILEFTHASGPRIVEEVRSIRFNQEQEEELMHRHLSMSLSMENMSSMDIREVTCQQDLITALVNKEKVHLPSPTQTVLIPPPSPAQPSICLSSQGFCLS